MTPAQDTTAISTALADADFVLIDGVIYLPGYRRDLDERTSEDDVVLEVSHGNAEMDFTRAELEDAAALGDGTFLLKSGSLLRFLSGTTLH